MAIIITGTAGCRNTKDGKEAFMPIRMDKKEFFLRLTESQNEKEPGHGKFSICKKDGTEMAECVFPPGHKYMHVYENLQYALQRGKKDNIEFDSIELPTDFYITENGLSPVTKKKSLRAENNRQVEKNKENRTIHSEL